MGTQRKNRVFQRKQKKETWSQKQKQKISKENKQNEKKIASVSRIEAPNRLQVGVVGWVTPGTLLSTRKLQSTPLGKEHWLLSHSSTQVGRLRSKLVVGLPQGPTPHKGGNAKAQRTRPSDAITTQRAALTFG